MRVVYGIHGYNRGHASRAEAVIADLSRRHDVMVCAGADAKKALDSYFEVHEIPSLAYIYDRAGRISVPRTLADNLPQVLDLFFHGPRIKRLARQICTFDPHLILSDAEPFTSRVAARLKVPRASFDHFGIMVHCDVPLDSGDRMRSALDRWVYRTLMGEPDRVLISSFYPAPPKRDATQLVGPLLRDEVHQLNASEGNHILVYLNRGSLQLTKEVTHALDGVGIPMRVYGTDRQGRDRNLCYRPAANHAFLEDLASAKAVISTAGNQLIGEAGYFGKALLVLPEDTVEQRMNAAAVERLGIGRTLSFDALTTFAIQDFLSRRALYAMRAQELCRDGRQEAVVTIDRWLHQLDKEPDRTTQTMGAFA